MYADEESGRADDHSVVFLFEEPRFLHAILPVASRTHNRTEKVRVCVSNFGYMLLLEFLQTL